MTCEECRERLDDLAAAKVARPEWSMVESHLVQCAACREDFEAARILGSVLEGLPRSIVPERSVWDGIESRLVMPPARGRLVRWALPIAAALAVVAVGTFLTRRDGPASPGALPEDVMAMATAYSDAAAELRAALSVAPPSAAETSGYLETIDRAIDETRSALLADPENAHLQQHLISTHRKKLDLLRQAAAAGEGE